MEDADQSRTDIAEQLRSFVFCYNITVVGIHVVRFTVHYSSITLLASYFVDNAQTSALSPLPHQTANQYGQSLHKHQQMRNLNSVSCR